LIPALTLTLLTSALRVSSQSATGTEAQNNRLDAFLMTGSLPEGTVFVKELSRVLTPMFHDGSRTEAGIAAQLTTANL